MADASPERQGAHCRIRRKNKGAGTQIQIREQGAILDGSQEGNLLRHARMFIDKRLHIVLCISRANKDQTEIRLDVPQLFGSFQD